MRKVFQSFPEDMNFRKFYALENEQVVLSFQHPVYKRGRGCQADNQVEFDDFGFKPFSFQEIFEMIRVIKPQVILGLTEEPRETYFEGVKGLKRSVIKAKSFFD